MFGVSPRAGTRCRMNCRHTACQSNSSARARGHVLINSRLIDAAVELPVKLQHIRAVQDRTIGDGLLRHVADGISEDRPVREAGGFKTGIGKQVRAARSQICRRINADVIHEHRLRKRRGAVGIARPAAADGDVQQKNCGAVKIQVVPAEMLAVFALKNW